MIRDVGRTRGVAARPFTWLIVGTLIGINSAVDTRLLTITLNLLLTTFITGSGNPSPFYLLLWHERCVVILSITVGTIGVECFDKKG